MRRVLLGVAIAALIGSVGACGSSDDGTADWAAPLAGSLGGVLLVVTVVLWRGRRPRHEEDF